MGSKAIIAHAIKFEDGIETNNGTVPDVDPVKIHLDYVMESRFEYEF